MTDLETNNGALSPDAGRGSEPRTRAESVAEGLRAMIIGGELSPGARLRQVEIASHFGVSTTPVREAFASLAREGFIRQDAHRGVEVFRPTVRDVRENYEIRLALECLAAELAASIITDGDMAEVDRIRLEIERPDVEFRLGTALNRQFHFAIYRAAKRELLLDMIERLRQSADAYVQLLLRQAPKGYAQAVIEEHRAIADALRARSPKDAHRATRRHLEHNLEHITALVQDLPS